MEISRILPLICSTSHISLSYLISHVLLQFLQKKMRQFSLFFVDKPFFHPFNFEVFFFSFLQCFSLVVVFSLSELILGPHSQTNAPNDITCELGEIDQTLLLLFCRGILPNTFLAVIHHELTLMYTYAHIYILYTLSLSC